MASIFEKLWRLGPAAFVLKAIIAALVANGLLLAFILLRRTYRKRYFAKRDARVYELRQSWDALVSGEIPFDTWRSKPFDRRIVEAIALDAFEAAGPEQSARLLKFLRTSGLIEKRIFEARHLKGWRRMRALVALGRTRAPEGIPALAEGLRDRDLETRLAALRGLGRMACPQAAEEILAWLGEKGLTVPDLPLQGALVQCCAERPQLLLPYIKNAESHLREVLGRVLGEVATPSLGPDLLQFVGDDLDELRAAAARAMPQTHSAFAPEVLSELAADPVWFVRLRAIVSLGKLSDCRAIPTLLRGLMDSNRLVRWRAAEALVEFKTEMVPIFEKVVAARDRYGLHAYLTALENAGMRGQLEVELQANTRTIEDVKQRLRNVLETGTLPVEEPATAASLPNSAMELR
ncbi:MAG TPA: HEAT repeat domain-containing protein [Candidatus Sulfotelmatobacter sp.]|jgi:HEAT repeat protein|nr:HEAT repeat domain-containing protein [Candidatus Sulfotelmatobacter sp.]